MRQSDRTQYILSQMLMGGSLGAGTAAALFAFPILSLPAALIGIGASASQAITRWDPQNPYEQFERDEGIFGTILGLATLPFAAKTTSDALLNRRLWNLANTDPLFHPDVVYPGIQKGFVGQLADGILARLGAYPDIVRVYRFTNRNEPTGIEPHLSSADWLTQLRERLLMKIPGYLEWRANSHMRGYTDDSPFLSVVLDPERLATSTDDWARTIVTGYPGSPGVDVAPDIGIFDVPASRLILPRPGNTLSNAETERVFLGNDLGKFLAEWIPNPYNQKLR